MGCKAGLAFLERQAQGFVLPIGGLGLASLGHFVCGPLRRLRLSPKGLHSFSEQALIGDRQ